MTIALFQIGGHSYNAYATLEEADAFLAIDPVRSAAWTAASTDTKEGRLAWASRSIDDAGTYSGTPQLEDQPLAFPRIGATCNGQPADKPLPGDIVEACILLAAYTLANPAALTQASSGTGNAQIKEFSAGPVSIEYFEQGAAARIAAERAAELGQTPLVVDPDADRLIRCYLSGATTDTGTGSAAGFASGTSDQSFFTDIRTRNSIDWSI